MVCQVALNYEALEVAIFMNNMTSIEITVCPKNFCTTHLRRLCAKSTKLSELEIRVKLHCIPAHHRMERQEQESLCLEYR
jgi:hypothetical protein